MAFLSCGDKCIKYLLFFFNLLIMLGGAVLIICGGVGVHKFQTAGMSSAPGIAVIVVGSIIFLIAFLGCCGAVSENSCALITFGVLLLIFLLLEIGLVVAVAVLTTNGKLNDVFTESFTTLMEEYGKDDATTTTVDNIQKALVCCGTTGPASWNISTKLHLTQSLPDSCCVKNTVGCGAGKYPEAGSPDFFQMGCTDSFVALAKAPSIAIIVILALLAFLTFMGLCFSFALAKSINDGSYQNV